MSPSLDSALGSSEPPASASPVSGPGGVCHQFVAHCLCGSDGEERLSPFRALGMDDILWKSMGSPMILSSNCQGVQE